MTAHDLKPNTKIHHHFPASPKRQDLVQTLPNQTLLKQSKANYTTAVIKTRVRGAVYQTVTEVSAT